MAETLDDAEFWLPPQFLADDDDKPSAKTKRTGDGLGFGSAFSDWGVFSDLSSPVGSSETESDEEDFLAGLSLQMARSTLQDDDVFTDRKARTLSGSPQSTLCAPLGCDHSSSRGSPIGSSSRVSSPPPPAPSPTTWELLSAAAGEVAKIRTQEDYFLHKQLQASQFEHLRQQQILKRQQQQLQAQRFQQMQQQQHQKQQRRIQSGEFHGGGKASRPLGLPQSAWPPLQRQSPQNGSGMRAVFLGNQGSAKRECAGTGVFLPRQLGPQQPETRRKQGCSTVLLPARVVQALNLNLEDMWGNGQPQVQPRFNGRFIPESDVALRLRSSNNNNNNAASYQRSVRPQQQVNHEIRLPQDWTY